GRMRATLVVSATRIVQQRRVLAFDRQHDAIDEAQQAFDDLVDRIVIGCLDGFAHAGSLRPRTGVRAGPARRQCAAGPTSRTGREAARARRRAIASLRFRPPPRECPSRGPASARTPAGPPAHLDSRAGSATRAHTTRRRVARLTEPEA